jgi:hypothetical protein
MRKGLKAALAAAAVLWAAGCATKEPPQIVEVEGVVLLEGEPLKKVEVRFIPAAEHGADYIAQGVTDDKGRFKLTCNGQPGAVVGEHYVTVRESEIPTHLTPESARDDLRRYLDALGKRPPALYGNAAESPLRATVNGEKKDFVFKLVRPPPK